MGKINDFAEQAKRAGSTASEKAKDFSDTVKLKTEINNARQNKNQMLLQLGKIVYQKEKDAEQKNPAYANLVDVIASYDRVIETKNEALMSIQNTVAPESGERTLEENEMYCPNCRKVIPKGKKFCMYCGCDLSAEM